MVRKGKGMAQGCIMPIVMDVSGNVGEVVGICYRVIRDSVWGDRIGRGR